MFAYDWASGFVSPFFGKDGEAFATPDLVIDRLLSLVSAGYMKDDPRPLLVDLGSGDGRIVLAAARRRIRAHGVELDHSLVEASRRAAQAEGLDCTFDESSLLEAQFPTNADLIAYLLPGALTKLAAHLRHIGHTGRLFALRFSCSDLEPVCHARHPLLQETDQAASPAGAAWVAYEYHPQRMASEGFTDVLPLRRATLPPRSSKASEAVTASGGSRRNTASHEEEEEDVDDSWQALSADIFELETRKGQ